MIHELNVKTGERTIREWTQKELAAHNAAVNADREARLSRDVSDDELVIEHLRHTMTEAERNAALQRIREKEGRS